MASAEQNNDDWKEIRSRVDSIANAVFLVAGGALSLSITVILGNKAAPFITERVVEKTVEAWYFLLTAVLVFLLLKIHLVLQVTILQFAPKFNDKKIALLNTVGWVVGISGFVCFCWGFYAMVTAAVIAIRH